MFKRVFLGLLGLSVTAFGWLTVAPSRLEAADLQTVRRRGRLVVAVKDNVRPLGFRQTDGELQGFEIDLARRLAEELVGRPNSIEFKPVLNQKRFDSVLSGEVDLAIAQITLTPSRLRILNCSLPYYRDGVAVLTRDAAVQSLSNLVGKPIAVLNGSSTIEAVRRALPQAQLLGVPSYQAAKTAIETGQAIAVAADASILAGWVQESPQFRLLTPLLSTQLLCIALPKGQQYDDLRREVDHILTRLQTSGWLEHRANYWGLPRNLAF